MTRSNALDTASRYFVNDLSDAVIPATRLNNVLDNLRNGRQLTTITLNYLHKQGLTALHRLAVGEVAYEAFCELAGAEQSERRKEVEVETLAREAKQKAHEAAWAVNYERERQLVEQAQSARESDPKHIAKVKNQQLRARYGLDEFIEQHCFVRLMDILRRVDAGSRLADEDVLWLKTEGQNYFTDILKVVFHEREAEFFVVEYRRTRDPWMAVNASGHYRKCGQAQRAQELLTSIPSDRRRTPKLKSAICTTHGGVMRDLKRWDEALQMGNQAHSLMPKDFRPCTLLGAVNMEMGNFAVASEWFVMAMERGASERSIDSDLRGIFARADMAKREEIKAFLLSEDPVRYAWVKSSSHRTPMFNQEYPNS